MSNLTIKDLEHRVVGLESWIKLQGQRISNLENKLGLGPRGMEVSPTPKDETVTKPCSSCGAENDDLGAMGCRICRTLNPDCPNKIA
jgi:hypothetical protein